MKPEPIVSTAWRLDWLNPANSTPRGADGVTVPTVMLVVAGWLPIATASSGAPSPDHSAMYSDFVVAELLMVTLTDSDAPAVL